MMESRSKVLSLYRQILRFTHNAHIGQRQSMLNQTREAFKKGAIEADANPLIAKAESHLSFLKMTTGRPANKAFNITGSYVVKRDGTVSEGRASSASSASGVKAENTAAGVNPADLRRHKQLIDRQMKLGL